MPYEHGTYTAYTHGKCRCVLCAQANTEYKRAQRAEYAEHYALFGHPAHRGYNATTYRTYSCRCELCAEAHRKQSIIDRHRRKNKRCCK